MSLRTALLLAALCCLPRPGQPQPDLPRPGQPQPDLPRPGQPQPDLPRPGQPLRILAVMTIDTMSHHLWMAPLTVELARRGHHVVSLDVARPREVPPTLNVSVIETAFAPMDSNWVRSFHEASLLNQMAIMHKFGLEECMRDLVAPAFRRILDKSFQEEFDLILLDYMSDCQLGLAHRFGYPGFVVLSPFPGSPWLHDLMGNPPAPAVASNTMMPFPHPMNLWQRASTAAMGAYMRLLEWSYRGEVDNLLRLHFGEDVPTSVELRQHVHLGLINDLAVLDLARPYVPSLVPVGGMHVQKANLSNIPEDLAGWLDSADKGFVLMSFGSVMKGANINKDTLRAFIDAFRALRDVRVLWKIEPEVVEKESLPANVRVEKWLPQNDILGHPKLRAFVTHCGGLSTHEASSNGVPMLAVPLVVDQFINADKVVRNGMARLMPFKEITKQRFVAELDEMLRNPTYGDAARRTAALLRDKPSSPLETAVWWCEYVGRHRGAPHLRSPALDVAWARVMLLDVAALLALAALTLTAAAALLVRTCLGCLRRTRGAPAAPKAKTS